MMISRIVKCVARLAVASLATGTVIACAAQVEPQDRALESTDQVEQALQLPNCDNGVGSGSGSKPLMGAGRDTSGEPKGQCKIGTFNMSWQCVRMPDGRIVPQNVTTSTDFCQGVICIKGSLTNPGAPDICYPSFICCG